MYPVSQRPWRVLLALIFTHLVATPALAFTPVHLSSVHYGGTAADAARAVAVAPGGDLIVAGEFSGSINLGGGTIAAGGSTDIFLACYTATGAYKWARTFGGTASEYAFSVAVDADGYILLTGYYIGSGYFGGTNLSSSSWDMIVARYAPDGAHQWSQRFGGTSIDRGNAVATDADGNVFVTGYFTNTVDFGGGPMTSAGGNDMFLVKFDAAGAHQWSRQFGSSNLDVGTTLAVDASGDVWASGSFYGTVDFGGGAVTSGGGSDVLLIRYDSDGVYQWAGAFGGTGSDQGNALAVTASDDVVLAGYFSGSVDFGGGALNSNGMKDAFVARFDDAGTLQWSIRGGGTANDEPGALCVDALDRVSVTGWFRGSADFGGGALMSNGLVEDVFLAVYDGGGVHQWSRRAGGTAADFGYAIATNSVTGTIYDAGAFTGTANFGGDDLTSNGNSDAFVAKYAHSAEPAISSVADVPNDQGLRVRITFTGSGLDAAESSTPITNYVAFRRNDPPPASVSSRHRARRQAQDAGWTPVASVHAHAFAEYSMDAPTVADSTAQHGVFHSVFQVRAVTVDTLTFYDSAPDSGYSVDNLLPGVPGSLVYASGLLSWTTPDALDLDHFTVYGSDAGAFGVATVIGMTQANTMDVSAAPFAFYFVTASDDAGNESAPAQTGTPTGSGTTPATFALGVSNYPNPFNPRTTVRYTVPARGRVTVGVYDARGARVATLVADRMHEAGAYSVEWPGRADGGAAVASGVYLLRIQHNGAARSSKVIVLK